MSVRPSKVVGVELFAVTDKVSSQTQFTSDLERGGSVRGHFVVPVRILD